MGCLCLNEMSILQNRPCSGRPCLTQARKAVTEIGQIREQFNAHQGTENAGSIRIGVGPIVASTLIGPAVARLIAHHPGIDVMAVTGYWKELLADLRSRSWTYIPGTCRMRVARSLRRWKLPKQEIVWFCRSGHAVLGQGAGACFRTVAVSIAGTNPAALGQGMV